MIIEMSKLAKYLKPFIPMIIAAIVFLFVEAICDLNLPNYMSDIVNVGLQQSGITSTVPDAMSETYFMQLGSLMKPDDAKKISDSYVLIKAGDENYTSKYPASKDKNIYVLKDNLTKEELDEIGNILSKSAGIAYYAMKGTEITDAVMSVEMMDEQMLKQVGIAAVKQIYTDLGMDLESIQLSYIIKTGMIMLVITLIGTAAAIAVGYLASRIAAESCRNIRYDLFSRVESFSSSEFDRFSTSSLITRTTNDVTQVQMLIIMAIRMLFYSPIIGVGGTIMALRKGPSISWVIALTVAVLIIMIIAVFNIAVPKFKITQKLIDKLNLVARENLSGIMAVRAFGNQDFEKERFDKANKDLTGVMLFISRVMVFMFPAIMFVMNLSVLLIVWVGANKISDAEMKVGDMMAFMQYSMQIIMSFLMLSMMFIMIPRASVSADRIAEVLSTQPSIVDPKKPKKFQQAPNGRVEFKNVSFKYYGAEENALENITFTAEPGKTTAIIGSTGAGKSTLINLIPRFYDVTAGQILVDGIDVRELPQKELRDLIGYVPQKGVLHSGTIASNLRYGKKDASDEEIKTAATVAQAMEFISKPDVGFEKEIAEGGTNVSGGQKQRLSIARALVKKPKIYIFDDSFSALDFKTDAALRKALKEYTGESTVIIVAQRVSTIMNAEQIIVLDEGKIVGMGTHRELLASCPTYLEIASSQLSKEELQ
ncbi:MAG: ABC-type multidrug transport system, ATPase and permease component [Oscillospiraceae bacterium]|jgi:ATP-binding cassette subfamily B protein|nr:ABC-type multidrug transport system, ATPase and permease component [Oscillospiraceae bacterium]